MPTENYYVFEMAIRNRREPIRQVNKSPLTLDKAKKLARIGAEKGKHDRAVTTNPTSRSFRVVAQYAAGTGKDVAIMYRRGAGGGAKRRPRKNPAVATASVECAVVPEARPAPMELPYEDEDGSPLVETDD